MTLQGRRPGDRRLRVEVAKPTEYRVSPTKRVARPRSPAAVLVIGFAVVIAIGAVILTLPIASASGQWTPILDALFTATSAVCVTGLVVLDTGTYWGPFGQAVLLVLMQVGGFGFMTGSTLLFILLGQRIGLGDRITAQATTGATDLGDVRTVIRRAAAFTLVVEGIGAAILTMAFLIGQDEPITQAVWWGVFHAVSAFNNVGLDLFGGFRSLSSVAGDPVILATFGLLILLGGLGFAIVGDAVTKRRWHRFTLETKIVLLTTAAILVVGTFALTLFEWSNPATLGAYPPAVRPLHALFETTTLRTAGFSSMPTGSLLEPTLVVIIAMMFIGGASGSAAGGIKVNTFAVLLVAIVSTVQGRPQPQAFGRRIPNQLVYRGLSVALLAIAIAFMVALGLAAFAEAPFLALLFEAISALGTVGASTGITPDLEPTARLLLIFAMFAGRLGPLTLVLALATRQRTWRHRPAVESMRIA